MYGLLAPSSLGASSSLKIKVIIVVYFALLILYSSQAFSSSGLNTNIIFACQRPSAGSNVTVTAGNGDSFSINLTAGTITPTANSTIFSIKPNGSVCTFTVSAGGSVAIAPAFKGMTFSDLGLKVQNSNSDSTGLFWLGSPSGTTAFTFGGLAADNISLTAESVKISRGASGTTNFYFGTSTKATTLTANPSNELGLSSGTANSFCTVPITLTATNG